MLARIESIHENCVGRAIRQGLERHCRLAEPEFAQIKECFVVPFLCWIHIRYEELGYVPSVYHLSKFALLKVVD